MDSLCACYLHNTVEADEVAQEAFVQIFRNLSQFTGAAIGLTSWLLAITRHCCIDRQRHNSACRVSCRKASSRRSKTSRVLNELTRIAVSSSV